MFIFPTVSENIRKDPFENWYLLSFGQTREWVNREYLEIVFKVVESSSGNISYFCSSLQCFSTLRLTSSNGLSFSLPLCRVQKQNCVCVFFNKTKKSHQPNCGSQWWVFIIPWCALSGDCRQRFRDKQGLGNITKGFSLNWGIFFLII